MAAVCGTVGFAIRMRCSPIPSARRQRLCARSPWRRAAAGGPAHCRASSRISSSCRSASRSRHSAIRASRPAGCARPQPRRSAAGWPARRPGRPGPARGCACATARRSARPDTAGQLMRSVHRERGLAHPGHPADRVNPHHPAGTRCSLRQLPEFLLRPVNEARSRVSVRVAAATRQFRFRPARPAPRGRLETPPGPGRSGPARRPAAGPSPPRPPGPPPRIHRLRADPQQAAISTGSMPCSNICAACSRTHVRRARPSAVSPPPSGYLMHPA